MEAFTSLITHQEEVISSRNLRTAIISMTEAVGAQTKESHMDLIMGARISEIKGTTIRIIKCLQELLPETKCTEISRLTSEAGVNIRTTKVKVTIPRTVIRITTTRITHQKIMAILQILMHPARSNHLAMLLEATIINRIKHHQIRD